MLAPALGIGVYEALWEMEMEMEIETQNRRLSCS